MVVSHAVADAKDRYVFIKKLAEGGMADVFLARDSGHTQARLCVVKQLLPDLRSKPEHVGMFLDEADLAVRLAHPNVVRALDRGTSRDGPFLVLEYLAGFDLDLVIERLVSTGGQFPWPLALHVIAATAEGMAYAHALTGADGRPLNLVHRDLTPSNIFITFDGLVKVLDFGIARAEERRTRTSTGMLKGKARYLAPELIRQLPADGRVDQFSLGAALYESLALKPLFSGDNELAVIHAIIEDRRPSLLALRPDLPQEIDAVFRRMTAKDRDARFPSMSEVATALRAVIPTEEQRSALANFLRQHFGSDFEAHAALMGRLASASTSELKVFFERGVNLADALGDPDRMEKTVVAPLAEIPAAARRTPMPPPGVKATALLDGPTELASPSLLAEAPLVLPPEEPVGTVPELKMTPRPARPASRPPSSARSIPGTMADEPNTTLRWALGLAVVLLVGVVFMLARRTPSAVALPTGGLIIRSTPPGASITLDGVRVQFKTPAALAELPPGVHEVRLEHPDSQVAVVPAQVVSGTQRTVEVALQPREALILFRVRPEEAVVSVDGQLVTLDNGSGTSGPLSAGPHEVEVRALGFRPYAATVTVQDGERSSVEVTLEYDPAAR